MFRKKLLACIVVLAAAMVAAPEVNQRAAAAPIAQPGSRPMVEGSGVAGQIEIVAYRRKFPRGGKFGYHRGRFGKHYGYNRHWHGKRRHYGYNRWNKHRWHGYPYYNYGWYGGAPWWYYGAALAYTVPYYYDSGYEDDYDGGDYGDAHVRRCLNRYRSYNPKTDLFRGYDGRLHRCRLPY